MIPIAKPVIGEEELEAVREVLESGIVVQGPKVAMFETAFAEYIGVRHAVAVNSGTAALHVAMLALGIKKGDEVIIPPMTFFATASTVLMCNARPTFADVDKETYTIDAKGAAKAASQKTKAIIPVHLYGQTADMAEVNEFAKERNLLVLEDAAQAHGAEFRGKKAGSLGDAACFSFYATKTMTTGEGGMVVTNNEEIAQKCRLLRDHGQSSKYHHVLLGYNYRMTEMAAAIGLVQLKKIGIFITQRRRNADVMTKGLGDIETVIPPREASGRFHTYYQYILRLEESFPKSREDLIKLLEEKGISARPSYPMPLYQQEAIKEDVKARKCPIAESVLPRLVELPVHPLVPRAGLESAIDVIRTAVKT